MSYESKYEQWKKGELPGVENPWNDPDVWAEYLEKCDIYEECPEPQNFEDYIKQFIIPKMRWKQIKKAQKLIKISFSKKDTKKSFFSGEELSQEEVPF